MLHTKPTPGHDEIKSQVDHVLNSTCVHQHVPTHPEPLKDTLELQKDLRLGPTIKALLANPYGIISLQYVHGKDVSLPEAAGCVTVGDAVALVLKKAEGK